MPANETYAMRAYRSGVAEIVPLDRGTERELDLHEVDDELRRHFSEQLGAMGVVTMGRAAYELMAGAWPTLGSTRERGSYVARIFDSRTIESGHGMRITDRRALNLP